MIMNAIASVAESTSFQILYAFCKSLYSSCAHRRSAPSLAASRWTDLSSSDHLSNVVSGRES